MRPISLALWFLLLAVALPGCGPVSFVVGVTPGDQRMTSTVVEPDGQWGSDRVALVDVSGVLINAEKPGLLQPGENPVSVFREQLVAAAADPHVKAVVLRINSPGGGVTASDAMYRELLRFRESTGKPVVALLMDVAASGGYYLACGADTIVAYPTSVTGSIGVIVQTFSVKRGLDRIGIETEALTSGPNKDAGSPFATMTPEQRATLQALVDDFYARFVDVVRTNRPAIPADRFAELTDGRVVTGEAAAQCGLADRAGDLHDAVALAKEMAGLERADLVRYHRPLDYVATPYAAAPAAGATLPAAQINLLQLNVAGLGDLGAPAGVYYLWRPDLP